MLIERPLFLQAVFRNVNGRYVLSIGTLKDGLFHGIVSNLGLYRVVW
jgi:hypothetical protein